MKILIVQLAVCFSFGASACIDQDAKKVEMATVLLQMKKSPSLKKCLGSLEREGIRLADSQAKKKMRQQGDADSVSYTYIIQGQVTVAQGKSKEMRIYIRYNQAKKTFECEAPTDKIPRCL